MQGRKESALIKAARGPTESIMEDKWNRRMQDK
jgi:hypothetical protein